MADQPTPSQPQAVKTPARRLHEVKFIGYPKLLFIWPLILAGIVFYPFGGPEQPASAPQGEVAPGPEAPAPATNASATNQEANPGFDRLGTLGWVYIWIAVVVLMTLGVDVDRNQFVFWLVVVALFWILGLWLKDAKGITVFGDIYRWFARLDVKYDRAVGLSLSMILLVPYVLMLLWARLNSRWRITHNEFEHYSLGKMNDSLGRGAKTIRTSFPDVLELCLGLAGTLIVYNATGTQELRRIPHVMFLPFVRQRLNKILETTAITGLAAQEEEDEEQ